MKIQYNLYNPRVTDHSDSQLGSAHPYTYMSKELISLSIMLCYMLHEKFAYDLSSGLNYFSHFVFLNFLLPSSASDSSLASNDSNLE